VWADWRRQEIALAYQRAYVARPQVDDDLGWVDEAGAATLTDLADE
jgi:hypothetical protein